jgi:hypothetical protein
MTEAQKVEALYARTLSRKPTDAELDQWTKYLANPPALADQDPQKRPKLRATKNGIEGAIPETRDPKTAAVEDLMWTLLNSSEFVLNH